MMLREAFMDALAPLCFLAVIVVFLLIAYLRNQRGKPL